MTPIRPAGQPIFRLILVLLCLLAVATGCSSTARPALPVPLEIGFAASERLNPADTGRPSPVVVRIFELSEQGAFLSVDFFALFESREALPTDSVVNVQEFVAMPGEVRVIRRKAAATTRFLGVAAGYRDVEGSAWRALVPVQAPHRAGTLWSGGVSPQQRFRIVVGARAVSIDSVPRSADRGGPR